MYIRELMATLARPSQQTQHTKVLHQLAHYLEPRLSPRQRTALATILNAYRDGSLSLGQTIAALRRQFDRHPELNTPVYLYPYPDSLRLREAL